jgi:hypothetical protein
MCPRNRYAYPSLFPAAQQELFVAHTERDARLLATNVTTAWEIAGTWERALTECVSLRTQALGKKRVTIPCGVRLCAARSRAGTVPKATRSLVQTTIEAANESGFPSPPTRAPPTRPRPASRPLAQGTSPATPTTP